MREILDLDDQVVQRLEELMKVTNRSFDEVVNDTLRKGLGVDSGSGQELPPFKVEPISTPFREGVDIHNLKRLLDEPTSDLPPFEVKPHSSAFRPGIDLTKLNQL